MNEARVRRPSAAAALVVLLAAAPATMVVWAADDPPPIRRGHLGVPAADGSSPAAARPPKSGRPGLVERLSNREFDEKQVEVAVKAEIAARTQAGVFTWRDPRTGTDLKLKFDQIKVVRGMRDHGWFPNVIFRDVADPKKQYAIDFWLRPEGDRLRLMDIRVQKGPRRDGDGWVMVTRLPVAWWWLPVSEHPGDTEVVRAWQVMSAIHRHVAETTRDGVYPLKDDKTGETLPTEFVEIHQPVRRLKGSGKYFACTDFRRAGSRDEYYDIDFWLDERNGKVSVGSVRVHKVPIHEDGQWQQVPRYDFKGLDAETVQ